MEARAMAMVANRDMVVTEAMGTMTTRLVTMATAEAMTTVSIGRCQLCICNLASVQRFRSPLLFRPGQYELWEDSKTRGTPE